MSKPWAEEISKPKFHVDAHGVVEKEELRIGQAESLKAMGDEFVFFTPAILYRFGVISDAPLIDFLTEYGKYCLFYYKLFDYALFAGLEFPDGDACWNRALWAVHKEHWAPFVDFMTSMAVSVRELEALHLIGMQTVRIMDPVVVVRSGAWALTESVDIHAFGVMSNRCCVAFDLQTRPLWAAPVVKQFSPMPEVEIFRRSWLLGHNPTDARGRCLPAGDQCGLAAAFRKLTTQE